jgi:putative endonuclease
MTRQKAERRGRRAETLAAWLLRAKGYRIIARRFRCPAGEIDLVAARGRTLVFVEVKTRGDVGIAAESLLPHQRRRIRNAAQAFLQRRPDLADRFMRFDAVLVSGFPRHQTDAWRDGDW